MKDRNDAALEQRAKIDQDVAATNEVQIREGRVHDYVLSRKDAHVANRLMDLVVAVDLSEESPKPLWGNVLADVFGVNPGPGFFDARIADIRRKDLSLPMRARLLEKLDQAHSQRISLFAGGTAANPEAQRGIMGMGFDQFREDFIL